MNRHWLYVESDADNFALGSARITVPNRTGSGEPLDVQASGQKSGGTAMTTVAPLPAASPAAQREASPTAGAAASPAAGG